jgi:hypothetical protein
MENPVVGATPSEAGSEKPKLCRLIRLSCAALLLLITVLPSISRAQTQLQVKPPGSNPVPEPAVSAILSAFDRYEIVGMGEAHGLKDKDDLILLLIRNPAFSEKVNDIVVECGNALYQPVLDRYIAGEDVPFTEVRKVWRNTTQPMCDWSGFFEQFYPLVRAINHKLPAGKKLRVLAGDPPIDWDQSKTITIGGSSTARRTSPPSWKRRCCRSIARRSWFSASFISCTARKKMQCQSTKGIIQTSRLSFPNLAFSIPTCPLCRAVHS